MGASVLEKEVIFKDDLEKIFGKRPFEMNGKVDDKSDLDANAENKKKEEKTS